MREALGLCQFKLSDGWLPVEDFGFLGCCHEYNLARLARLVNNFRTHGGQALL